ncbi:MAG: GNAT family N-acetyltransferase [Acidimicrobiia bacterium]
MEVTARPATLDDLPVLEQLYRALEKEMVALHPMWPLAGGLAEPVPEALAAAVAESDTLLYVGEIDDCPLGFLVAQVESLLPQADGEEVGAIRLVFTDYEARQVGVGEAMRAAVMDALRERGVTKFDAHVLPGHRLAKNFFEAGGFSARSIVMFHDDVEP